MKKFFIAWRVIWKPMEKNPNLWRRQNGKKWEILSGPWSESSCINFYFFSFWVKDSNSVDKFLLKYLIQSFSLEMKKSCSFNYMPQQRLLVWVRHCGPISSILNLFHHPTLILLLWARNLSHIHQLVIRSSRTGNLELEN